MKYQYASTFTKCQTSLLLVALEGQQMMIHDCVHTNFSQMLKHSVALGKQYFPLYDLSNTLLGVHLYTL